MIGSNSDLFMALHASQNMHRGKKRKSVSGGMSINEAAFPSGSWYMKVRIMTKSDLAFMTHDISTDQRTFVEMWTLALNAFSLFFCLCLSVFVLPFVFLFWHFPLDCFTQLYLFISVALLSNLTLQKGIIEAQSNLSSELTKTCHNKLASLYLWVIDHPNSTPIFNHD